MYCPYLKSFSAEQLALVSFLNARSNRSLLPIIEPIKLRSTRTDEFKYYKFLTKMLQSMVTHKLPFICRVKSLDSLNHIPIENLSDYCILGLDNTNEERVNGEHAIALIHNDREPVYDAPHIQYHVFLGDTAFDENYVQQFPPNKIIKVSDSFEKFVPNANFPAQCPYPSFINEVEAKKIVGFGDYLIQTADFKPTRGGIAPLITAVLHLVRKENTSFIMHHFKATPIEDSELGQRILRTVQQAIAHQDLFPRTLGFNLIEEVYNRPSHGSTNLFYLKRIGFEHHLDLMNHYALTLES